MVSSKFRLFVAIELLILNLYYATIKSKYICFTYMNSSNFKFILALGVLKVIDNNINTSCCYLRMWTSWGWNKSDLGRIKLFSEEGGRLLGTSQQKNILF